ncbi:MAG: nucleotidyltransferase family protein [Limnochordia bacterium]|jgi:GTP:adenosylcobinamide-phosphate guanylyltransferase
MRVDAVVLAGARNNGRLRRVSSAPYEALIEIGDRVMVDYVLAALRRCSRINRIVVAGPEELRTRVTTSGVEFTPGGESMIESIRVATDYLGSKDKVLLVTGDIPLITEEAILDFLQRCQNVQADIYYPVVKRETNESKYPGARRTYMHLKEGVFTGGNLVLLQPEIVAQCHDLIDQAIQLRKKPRQLAKLLGGRAFFKLLFRQLSIKEIEARVHEELGFAGVAIISPFPEVGIDVDKPTDYEMARQTLGRR